MFCNIQQIYYAQSDVHSRRDVLANLKSNLTRVSDAVNVIANRSRHTQVHVYPATANTMEAVIHRKVLKWLRFRPVFSGRANGSTPFHAKHKHKQWPDGKAAPDKPRLLWASARRVEELWEAAYLDPYGAACG